MVALAIIAVALGAGGLAAQAMLRQAERQQTQWLAQVCADNALTGLRLNRTWPDLGERLEACEQGPHRWQVRLSTSATPNPSFRRVQASVEVPAPGPASTLLTVSTLVGRD